MILPPALHFLTNYDSKHYDILIRARDYYRFVSFVLLGGRARLRGAGLRARARAAADPVRRAASRDVAPGIFVMTVIGVLLPGVDPVSTISR